MNASLLLLFGSVIFLGNCQYISRNLTEMQGNSILKTEKLGNYFLVSVLPVPPPWIGILGVDISLFSVDGVSLSSLYFAFKFMWDYFHLLFARRLLPWPHSSTGIGDRHLLFKIAS